jgi:hypothetical protein
MTTRPRTSRALSRSASGRGAGSSDQTLRTRRGGPVEAAPFRSTAAGRKLSVHGSQA